MTKPSVGVAMGSSSGFLVMKGAVTAFPIICVPIDATPLRGVDSLPVEDKCFEMKTKLKNFKKMMIAGKKESQRIKTKILS